MPTITIPELKEITVNNAPEGFIEDADGNLMRKDKLKAGVLKRDRAAKKMFNSALLVTEQLCVLYEALRSEIQALIDAAEASDEMRKLGGAKGNVTIFSYNKAIKIERARQDKQVFNEKLTAAKTLIDECLNRWSKGANHNLQEIIKSAFKTDKEGKFSINKVLSLKKVEVSDPQWLKAMQMLDEALEPDKTSIYYRVYFRDETGQYQQLPLDMALINRVALATHTETALQQELHKSNAA